MNKSKGFTIIELIVVIAIIAVLAAIVMVNVTSYIAKGKDVSIKGNLSTALTNAAVYYDTITNYTSVCTDAVYGFKTALDAAGSVAGAAMIDCNASSTQWAACAQLLTEDKYFCVDYTGAKKSIATKTTCVATATFTVCP
ncbi:MAG: prepilin-type N-terminal cleavage/methylation domain-containing protein [bacterium]|nr:prepilin-type N-terminal cleavage/methylation domain-containing protein [bacterium]